MSRLDSQLILLFLIKRSQFGGEQGLISYEFPLQEDQTINWSAVYEEARFQSVLGIVEPEIPSEVKALDGKWKHVGDRTLAEYVRYCFAESNLKQVLDEAGIPFVILKGNAAAIYYSTPSRRMMGDIDFLVPQNAFEKAKKVLIDKGYTYSHVDPQNRHIAFRKNGISFELHHHFSHTDLDFEAYIIEGLNNRITAKIDQHDFPMLPKLANGLVLLDHMRHHIRNGLGLRQVIDWMMFVNKELDDDFWQKEFGKVAREKGMDTLAVVTTKMCQIYLGLSDSIKWCSAAENDVCDELLDMLFVYGNFGKKNNDEHGKGVHIEYASMGIKRMGLFKWLQHAGENNWRAYKRHPWLKPFCWAYQACRYVKKGFQTKRSRKQLSEDVARSRRRSDLLKKLGVQ